MSMRPAEAVLIVLLFGCAASPPAASNDPRIARWIELLGSESHEERAAAHDELMHVGFEGEALVKAALKSPDLERADRAEQILKDGLLGSMIGLKWENLLRYWDRHSDQIVGFFMGKTPTLKSDGIVAPGETIRYGGDLESFSRQLTLDEFALTKWVRSFLVTETFVFSTADASFLADCDGTRSVGDICLRHALKADALVKFLLTLQSEGIVTWEKQEQVQVRGELKDIARSGKPRLEIRGRYSWTMSW
jgi:hypothetical protein